MGIASLILISSSGPFGIEIRNNTVFIVMPPDLGPAELLKQSFQTGLAFLGSLMSLSEKLVSGLPFFESKLDVAKFAPMSCKDISKRIIKFQLSFRRRFFFRLFLSPKTDFFPSLRASRR